MNKVAVIPTGDYLGIVSVISAWHPRDAEFRHNEVISDPIQIIKLPMACRRFQLSSSKRLCTFPTQTLDGTNTTNEAMLRRDRGDQKMRFTVW